MKALLLLLSIISYTQLQSICQTPNLTVGDQAPNFELYNQNGEIVRLSDFSGKKVALYFYPKDNTYGCAKQARSLRDSYTALQDAGIIVLGVSKGSKRSKQKFITEQQLPFPLLIATKDILKKYGVFRGFFSLYMPMRWTFLIDENGIIIDIIKNVNTKHHAQQILDAFNKRPI